MDKRYRLNTDYIDCVNPEPSERELLLRVRLQLTSLLPTLGLLVFSRVVLVETASGTYLVKVDRGTPEAAIRSAEYKRISYEDTRNVEDMYKAENGLLDMGDYVCFVLDVTVSPEGIVIRGRH